MSNEWNPTDAELKALRAEYASNANDNQFELWMAACRHRRLQPVTDIVLQVRSVREYDPEIKAKVYKKRPVLITTINALRRLAERTGKYGGLLPSEWVYLDDTGNPSIRSPLPLPDPQNPKKIREPWAAIAYVVRKDFEKPIQGMARFRAYCQTYDDGGVTKLNSTWSVRGPEQLEKCAESLACRRAFPEETAGLYIAEEIREDEGMNEPAREKMVDKVISTPPQATTTPSPVNQEPAKATDNPRPNQEEPLFLTRSQLEGHPEPDKPHYRSGLDSPKIDVPPQVTELVPDEKPLTKEDVDSPSFGIPEPQPVDELPTVEELNSEGFINPQQDFPEKLAALKTQADAEIEKREKATQPMPREQKLEYSAKIREYVNKYNLDKEKVRLALLRIAESDAIKNITDEGWKTVLKAFTIADGLGKDAIQALVKG